MSHVVYRFGQFTVDLGAHVLLKEQTRLSIQEQPLQVLLALLEHPGQVVTRETLRRRLWGTDTFVDFDQSLNSAVRRLRLALEDNSREPVFVETIPRIGFRFLPTVSVEDGGRPMEAPAVQAVVPAAASVFDVREFAAAVPPAMVPAQAAERSARRFPTVVAGAGVLVFVLGLLLGVVGSRASRGDATAEGTLRTPPGQTATGPGNEHGLMRIGVFSETGDKALPRGGAAGRSELQGWYHLRQRTQEDYVQAKQEFEEALRREPTNAAALVGLGQAQVLMALNGDDSRARLEQARQAGRRALALAPHLASAHTVIGAADALVDWNDAEAEQEFRTALHLDPQDSLSHLWYAVFVLLPRREYGAAEQEAMTAVQQDPLSLIAHTDLGWILYSEGKREAALEEYRFVLRLRPGFVPAAFRVRQIMAAEGRENDRNLLPLIHVENAAATRINVNGETVGACADASHLPMVQGNGRLPALRAAVEERCPTAFFFGQDPELAQLKHDPAFQTLLQETHPAHGVR